MDIIDRFKLCMTIAKSEISILEPEQTSTLFDPLRLACGKIVAKPIEETFFEAEELFILCLNIQLLIHSKNTHFIKDIFTQMFKRTIDYLK